MSEIKSITNTEIIFKKKRKGGFKGNKATTVELSSHLSEQKNKETLDDIFLKKFANPLDSAKMEEQSLKEDFVIVKNDTKRIGKTKNVAKPKPKSPERNKEINEDTYTLVQIIGVDKDSNEELMHIKR